MPIAISYGIQHDLSIIANSQYGVTGADALIVG